jgi:BioD-like phosphotransacetylase family protein
MSSTSSPHVFFLAPLARDVGFISMALGLVQALQRERIRVGFAEPIARPEDPSGSTHLATHDEAGAAVPFEPRLTAPRPSDVVEALGLDVAYEGDLARGWVQEIVVSGRGVEGVIDRFHPGALILAAGERSDIALAAGLAYLHGTKLSTPSRARTCSMNREIDEFGVGVLIRRIRLRRNWKSSAWSNNPVFRRPGRWKARHPALDTLPLV